MLSYPARSKGLVRRVSRKSGTRTAALEKIIASKTLEVAVNRPWFRRRPKLPQGGLLNRCETVPFWPIIVVSERQLPASSSQLQEPANRSS